MDLQTQIKTYYTAQQIENNRRGDTDKRRDLILKALDSYKQAKEKSEELEPQTIADLEELKQFYYDVLIFTPTIEDMQEMKYWI